MSDKVQTTEKNNRNHTDVQPPARQPQREGPQVDSIEVVQRMPIDPSTWNPQQVIHLQRTLGNRAVNRLMAPRPIQAKLAVGAADDKYEAEAARGGEQVMRKPGAASIAPLAQRVAQTDEEEIHTSRTAASESFDTTAEFDSRLSATRSSGSPLPDSVREFMEPRFGADFSKVRIHADDEAAQLNRTVSAQAFTQGSDIYLGEGQTDLTSSAGQQLLAHELTHTLQQGAAVVNPLALQRRVKPYKDDTENDDMETLAGVLSDCVDLAKSIVDANPLLKDVSKRDEGYLNAWVTTFTEFTTDGEIPTFFYARYGYAIETIATRLFMTKNHGSYKVEAQATYGSTRPDFVIRNGSTDVAWIDITSAGSKEHIYDKQGGGWKTRPYVAEILYEMPNPAAFAETAKGSLTAKQVKALKEADQDRAKRELEFDKGMRAMGQILGEVYAAARQKKGSGLSKTDVKGLTIEVCRARLNEFVDKGVTPKYAAGVLASIESIEVAGEVSSGLNWAKWAFGEGGDQATGRSLLWDFGKAA